ncbi:MAG TPA: glycosyltransferase [Rhizomicrobium sp.]|jgi:glycosyltransferase involved in cell wall biosynthesis
MTVAAGSLRSSMIDKIDIAVIVPVFKQPGFLAEALASVIDQKADIGIGIIVVDDGCPFEETRAVALTFAREHPGRVCYIQRANGGLSAARNTGIEWALQAWPTIKAVYLLDADNRLHPKFLARAFSLLRQSPPDVGWIYPDFDMFGVPKNASTRGEYSKFMHLIENNCEAGSLISRDLLAAGIRFDETMREGFEDWDFWLQAIAAGFAGRHLPRAGFQYRKRMESMLAESERKRDGLLAQLRTKPGRIPKPHSLIALAQKEMPAFACYLDAGEEICFTADPLGGVGRQVVTPEQSRRRFIESLDSPAAVYFPPVMCFAAEPAVAMLCEYRLLRNVFWHAQRLLRRMHCVVVSFEEGGAADFSLRADEGVATGAASQSSLLFLQTQIAREAVCDLLPNWLASIAGERPEPFMATIRITLPAGAGVAGLADLPRPIEYLLEEIDTLRVRCQARAGTMPAQWRDDTRTPRDGVRPLETLLQCGPTLPYEKPPGRDIGFILPLSSFGGVERGIRNYASALRKKGWRPHLFLMWDQPAHLTREAIQIFDSVNFLAMAEAEYTHPERHHFGVWTSELGDRPLIRDALGLVAGMDVVLNNHSFAGHALAASLRRLGIKTYVGLHLTERMPSGQPLGNTHIALSYEHAYDGLLVISDQLRQWCIGQAVPDAKIHIVRNAPAYASAPGAALRAIKARRHHEGPLRILFLGRFDRQKGLDRLTEIIRRTRTEAIEWRLIGKSVIEDSSVELASCEVGIEPPAHTSDELDALYAWADVVILTSRFEGVPLTILEAQRMGCVAVSTNVGAVAEIVSHGVDGLLVPADLDEEAIVGLFCDHLYELAFDRTKLRSLGLRAARRASQVSWDKNLTDFISHLDRVCPSALP